MSFTTLLLAVVKPHAAYSIFSVVIAKNRCQNGSGIRLNDEKFNIGDGSGGNFN